ncbi:MAG: hypothetical protein ACLQVD_19905 [Capsulimonadaceae bacterium]
MINACAIAIDGRNTGRLSIIALAHAIHRLDVQIGISVGIGS